MRTDIEQMRQLRQCQRREQFSLRVGVRVRVKVRAWTLLHCETFIHLGNSGVVAGIEAWLELGSIEVTGTREPLSTLHTFACCVDILVILLAGAIGIATGLS